MKGQQPSVHLALPLLASSCMKQPVYQIVKSKLYLVLLTLTTEDAFNVARIVWIALMPLFATRKSANGKLLLVELKPLIMMVCVKLYVHQMLCPIKSVKIVTTAASNVLNVKLRLQIAKYVNWDISSKE